jgi:hypothetical protein
MKEWTRLGGQMAAKHRWRGNGNRAAGVCAFMAARLQALRMKNMRALARDEDGQSVALAALLILVLVMFLTVTLNLAIVAHQKIQVQTAVDAAAMAGAVWQLRGMNFTQNMNNLIWISDALTDMLITGAWISGKCAMGDPTGIAIGVGNVLLGLAMAANAVVSLGMIPFRALAVRVLFPLTIFLSGSDMASRNGATTITGLADYGVGLGLEYQLRRQEEVLGTNVFSEAGGLAQMKMPSLSFDLPLYAVGLELHDSARLISLHVNRKQPGEEDGEKPGEEDGEASDDWPLAMPQWWFDQRLNDCFMLQPLYGPAMSYFTTMKGIFGDTDNNIWKHGYYATDGGDEGGKRVVLPPSTWIATIRESDRSDNRNRFGAWTGPWRSMGGLGVPRNLAATEFGELGVIGMASARIEADPVVKIKFGGIRGRVQMVPVTLDQKGHALEYGICH